MPVVQLPGIPKRSHHAGEPIMPRRRRPPLALGAGLLLGMIGTALLFVFPPPVGIAILILSAMVIVSAAAIGLGTYAKRRRDERPAQRGPRA